MRRSGWKGDGRGGRWRHRPPPSDQAPPPPPGGRKQCLVCVHEKHGEKGEGGRASTHEKMRRSRAGQGSPPPCGTPPGNSIGYLSVCLPPRPLAFPIAHSAGGTHQAASAQKKGGFWHAVCVRCTHVGKAKPRGAPKYGNSRPLPKGRPPKKNRRPGQVTEVDRHLFLRLFSSLYALAAPVFPLGFPPLGPSPFVSGNGVSSVSEVGGRFS